MRDPLAARIFISYRRSDSAGYAGRLDNASATISDRSRSSGTANR